MKRSLNNEFALAAVCLTALMFGLEISSVPAVLPTLAADLHADFKALQWIMNAYTLACTTVLMATGSLADRFGRKRVYAISIVLFAITSLACGLAQTTSVLIVSRFLQGVAGGAMLICQVAILSHQFQEGRERSRAFGVWGIIFGIGLGFGPMVGGAIVALTYWSWVFLVHVLISMVALWLTVSGVQESRDPHAQTLDIGGILTLSISSFCLVYFITQGAALGWGSRPALGMLLLALISFVMFVVIEMRTERPTFDFSVFRIRAFSGAMFGSMGMNFSYWPFMIYLPIYFHGVLGYDGLVAGLALLSYTLPTLLVPPLAERLAAKYGAKRVIPLGMFTIGLGFLLMKLGTGAPLAGWLAMLPGCVLCGTGLGLTNTPATNTATGAVSPNRAGMASGIDMSARLISLAINIAVMGFLLLEGVHSRLARALPEGWDAATSQRLAEQVAAGEFAGFTTSTDLAMAHAALVCGFEWVMLYGMAGAWLLALLSRIAFGVSTKMSAQRVEP
nr:MFS transporter [Pandoraea horticolens]